MVDGMRGNPDFKTTGNGVRRCIPENPIPKRHPLSLGIWTFLSSFESTS